MTPRDSLRATLVAIIWGANFVVIDEGLKGFPPFLLLTARFLLVAFPLIFFVPKPGPWRQILWIGAFMSLGQFTLLYLALHLGMPAGLASLLVQAQVICTIGISRVVLGEHPTRQQFLGVVIGLVGLAVLVIGHGSHTPLGPVAIVIGACVCWAIGNVMSRRAQISSGFGLTVWSAVVVPVPAHALALVINGPHELGHAVAHVGWLTIGSTLYTVLGASLFGYGAWNSLLSRYPVGSVVPFTLLVPVTGIATAWIVLAQQPTLTEMLGGLVLLIGVATATLQRAGARPGANGADPYPESAPPERPPLDCQLSPSPASPA
jgi:O-acetylserine/cysteine efflux transporter